MRDCNHARTADPTPKPPIRSAVSPTRIKKASARAIKASKPGAADETSRIRPCVCLRSGVKTATAFSLSSGLSSRIFDLKDINEPGLIRPVSATVSDETKTRGPKPPKLMVLSGSETKVPATTSSASPNLTLSPTASDRLRIKDG